MSSLWMIFLMVLSPTCNHSEMDVRLGIRAFFFMQWTFIYLYKHTDLFVELQKLTERGRSVQLCFSRGSAWWSVAPEGFPQPELPLYVPGQGWELSFLTEIPKSPQISEGSVCTPSTQVILLLQSSCQCVAGHAFIYLFIWLGWLTAACGLSHCLCLAGS